jgi:hypothetical protein
MAGIVKKIVNNFDDKWMGILFHELNFIEYCLTLSRFQEFHWRHRPFDSEYLLIMLSDGPEDLSKTTRSYKVSFVSFKQVGITALLWKANRFLDLCNLFIFLFGDDNSLFALYTPLIALLGDGNSLFALYNLLIALFGDGNSFTTLYTLIISHLLIN